MTKLLFFDTKRGDIPLPVPALGQGGGFGYCSHQVNGGVAINPASTGADVVAAVFNVPAGLFDVEGHGFWITASGNFAAGNTNTKRAKIIYNPTNPVIGQSVSGGTLIADTGAVTTNGSGWQISAACYKTGISGSNTQLAIHTQAQAGGSVSALIGSNTLSGVEANAIPIAVTLNATTNATDISLTFLEVDGAQ